jgi:hypothetical protein
MGMFDEEPGSDRLNPVDCLDHLLLVWAVGYTEHSPTKYTVEGKKSDVIHVDCVDLDIADDSGFAGKVFRNCWWRNARLIGFMRPKIGREKPVPARMVLGIPTMGKPPFELELATSDPAAMERAQAWMLAHPEFRPTGFAQSNSLSSVINGGRTESVDTATVPQRQKSQLELMAERQGQQKRDFRDALPPPPPPAADRNDNFPIPF